MALLSACPVPIEVLGDGYAPDGGNFGASEQSQTMLFTVAYADEAAAIQFLLGYSKTGPGPGFLLSRILPCQHPRYPRLWATRVATKPYVPLFDAAHSVMQVPPFAGLVDGAYGPYPQYARSQLTVSFNTVGFKSLTDAQLAAAPYLGAESYRYVQELCTLSLENIQLRQGTYAFYSGAGADAFPGAAGQIPTVKPTIRINTRTLTWKWFDVPQNYLLNAAGIPSGLDALNGRVNLNAFHGYPPGTLLCLPPKYVPRDAPVDAVVLGLDAADHSLPARYFDVEFTFAFIDPPRPAGYSVRGHTLGLYEAKGLFYLITRQEAARNDSGDQYRIYQAVDFEIGFKPAP